MGEPAIRAGWPKLAMRFVKQLPTSSSDAIYEQIGSVRERIRECSFRDLLALQDLVTLADATFDVLGLVATRSMWKGVMLEALAQPAVGELVRRAGPGNDNPIPLLQRTADAFHFVHHHCGQWLVEPHEPTKKVLVTLDQAPLISIRSPGMLAVYWGNLSAAMVSLSFEAKVSVSAEPDAGRARFTIRW